jgi:hypothetical protein
MEIRLKFVVSPEVQVLLDRLYEVADAQGIDRDEAFRQALRLWLESVGAEDRERTLVITQAEFGVIEAVLGCLRQPGA